MALDLLKRAEKGTALSAIEHDDNFTAIETEVNGKAATSHTHPSGEISDSTAAGRTLLTAATAAAQRAALNVEDGAAADQTGAEIKALYEAELDTNAFTDAEKSKLGGIEASATADQTPAEILTALLGVDGTGSGLDADTLDGLQASAFLTPADIASGAITARVGAIDFSGGADGDVLTVQADGRLAVETPAGGVGDATSIQGVPVDATAGTPADGNILVFRDAGSDWVLEAKPAGGANPALNDVTDVTITSVADDEVLAFDVGSGEWINQSPAEAGLAAATHEHPGATPGAWTPNATDLSNPAGIAYDDYTQSAPITVAVTGTPAEEGYALINVTGDGSTITWSGIVARPGETLPTSFTGEKPVTIWRQNGVNYAHVPEAASSGDATSIQGVSIDATVGSPNDGDIMVYRSAGTDWVLEAKPAGGANPALADVTDVTITAVADNEVLAFDSGSGTWINQTPAEAGLAAATFTLQDLL